ncbi:DUF4020 domain-containing protein [Kribbella sp. C-35]|uniref:DUF4020 domain-containing protein n=1 Tax=Kribbella sp. C-35 TaxID=2789276 RepID=UPI00397E3F56
MRREVGANRIVPMRIRDVEFPAELIEAHRAGELVIFVGAGASMGAPSSLPDFKTLATDVALEAERSAPAPGVQLDWFLGDLADKGVEVHRRVADHLTLWTSRPNRLHRAVAELAMAGGEVRIVTTNYDLHLSSALKAAGADFAEFVGPALPMGDDFTGIVYLHGRLGGPTRRLVLTAEDFGRAYLRDAWAARFLERMFATFSVLFVGYSHSDVVMRYLARALGPGKKRYSLTDDGSAPEWTTLGITPLEYPNADRTFAALPAALEGWAEDASMGSLGHQQRLRRLVSSAPTEIPEDLSYLNAVVADPQRVGLFTDVARGKTWLDWITAHAEFRRLFDPSSPVNGCTYALADWFATHFAIDEDLTADALRVITSFGGRIEPVLWNALAHALHRAGGPGGPRPRWLRPWPVLLMETASPDASFKLLEYALMASSWPAERSAALLLFDYLSEPIMQSRRSYGLGGPFSVELNFRGSGYWLKEAQTMLFDPVLPEVAPDLVLIAERHLQRAYHLLAATDSGPPRFDPVSFRRPTIAEDGRPSRPVEPMDVLIDVARDALTACVSAGDGEDMLRTWAASEVPILRRLAVHTWGARGDVDSTSKLEWLLSANRLQDHHLRTEVMSLVAAALPSVTADVAQLLVSQIVALGDEIDGQSRFFLLGWTADRFPEMPVARSAFEELELQFPDLTLSEPPTTPHRFEFSHVEQQLPMSPSELHRRLDGDAAEAVTELLRYKDRVFPDDGPTWSDALQLIVQTLREWPSDGFVLLDSEVTTPPAIVSAVVGGWSIADVDDAMAQKILQRLSEYDVTLAADDLSRMLADGGQSELNPTQWHRFSQARTLAHRVWNTSPPELEIDDTEPNAGRWLERSIASTHGRLAMFWMRAIAGDWRALGEEWVGIPEAARQELEPMLDAEDPRGVMAGVVLASRLRFLSKADWGWCESELLPLFAWSAPARARRIWESFLYIGQWTDELLGSGLLDGYLDTVSHLETLPPELSSRLADHLASIALYSRIRPTGWLRAFVRRASAEHRREWADRVSWSLDTLEPAAVEQQWQRWIRQYWHDRLSDIPLPLTESEASAMACWAVYLTDSADDAVILATSRPARLVEHDVVLERLADDRLRRAPRAFGKLIAHLLKGTQEPCWSLHELPGIVSELNRTADPADLAVIRQEAVRLRVPLTD